MSELVRYYPPETKPSSDPRVEWVIGETYTCNSCDWTLTERVVAVNGTVGTFGRQIIRYAIVDEFHKHNEIVHDGYARFKNSPDLRVAVQEESP